MPLKYAYHPGNAAHSGSPEVSDTMEAVARNLGLELTYLDGATSCGAGIIKASKPTSSDSLERKDVCHGRSPWPQYHHSVRSNSR